MLSSKTATTREKLLAAGLTLFSSKGFLATTTRELAQEAGVAEITLFRYFPSKEKLLEEVVTSYSMIPALKALQPELNEKPCAVALTYMADFLLDSMIKQKEWIILMQSEVRRNPEKLLSVYHAFLDRVYSLIADYFRSQQKVGVMREFDADLAARAFYGMIFSFFNTEEILQRKQYRDTPRTMAITTFVGLFAQGASA
ncbi:TetR/AcrR family transcriptional regulator [Geobacter pelophilus]|jgi:AcrR family transcriptional regulator|uniref:TetR/AcrR family transcriptional regulator n=1 Tax=Geoanaerobacter pelophilus TaxID=60036 RepID=A0AAW4LE89_9BACT|nr:TetR/AcrR family transcriptional regulator [Geoanaerobacter pelophilus]MBT0665471.1 TetR/AcrR family transcriptional regulator [Geoanaerobacter pelophilus]